MIHTYLIFTNVEAISELGREREREGAILKERVAVYRSFNKRKIRFSSNNRNINLISGISSRDCEYLCKFESTLLY